MSMIVPSGIYSDQGSTALRTLFLEHSSWEWLFSFENRDGIFAIHRSFKFNPLIVQKGGRTESVRTGFMHHALQDWEDAEKYALDYPGDRVLQFSPVSKALLEIRSQRELLTLEKLYANGVLLGDQSEKGWGIRYTREFDMTNDSKLFPPRPEWEAKGYRADEYGHWLKGGWIDYGGPKNILERERDLVLSADGQSAIAVRDIEDVALPLYQGVMIQQFDFSAKGWVSGTGLRARWDEMDWQAKRLAPQFLMGSEHFRFSSHTRVSHRRMGRTTDTRSVISAAIPTLPAGDMAPIFDTEDEIRNLALVAVLNSFAYEYVMRARLIGTHLDYHVFEQTPLPHHRNSSVLSRTTVRLNTASSLWAPNWKRVQKSWKKLWAVTPSERLRLKCVSDAVVAAEYSLTKENFTLIVRECDYPESVLADKQFRYSLDSKGFWRVDKEKPPHLRHTVLSLIAFHELERIGLEAFLALNDGEGWMLPETLRLADYGLGHDDRAKEHQPVASVLGPRFYDWQLSQSVEESWEECARHAKLLAKIVPQSSPEAATSPAPLADAPTNLFGDPVPTDLFGNPEFARPGRKRP